jgi:hypothetical protein
MVYSGVSGNGTSFQLNENELGATLYGACDNEIGQYAGCVDYTYVPVVWYDGTGGAAIAPIAQHIYDAQSASGGLPSRWGVPGAGSALQHNVNKADQRKNRSVACPGSPPAGTSCDEFPFASTYQGAAFVAANDYSTRYVTPESQQAQAGLMSTFYQYQRVLDGDPFWVRAIAPNGAYSW